LYSEPYQIRNSGQATIYLGKDTSVSSTQYDWSLSPGDTLGFGANTYLYLICAPGETSTLEQQYGALGNFTPAPSQILANLANQVTLLGEETATILPGAQVYGINPISLDVSRYSSVIITIEILSASLFVNPANYIETDISFNNEDKSIVYLQTPTSHFMPQWLLVPSYQNAFSVEGVSSIQLPITGQWLYFALLWKKGITPTGGDMNIKVYGSNQQLNKPIYISRGVGLDDSLTNSGLATVKRTTPGVAATYVGATNGLSYFSLLVYGASTGTHTDIFVAKNGILSMIFALAYPSTSYASQQSIPLSLPLLPIQLALATSDNIPITGAIAQ